MAKHLTEDGKCPVCTYRVSRQDKDHTEVILLIVKAMRISTLDGSVTGECPRCKNILELPEIKVKKTEMSKVNATIFKKTNQS